MDENVKLMLGNNIDKLKELPNNFVDSIVTDPPYGISFMNKKWDYDVPSVEFWKEVYRVLKPGGHILSFGGTRTYHRMVVNIEDAGFEIRDQIMWVYGSGFPKSLNIGKAVDKIEGNEREVLGLDPNSIGRDMEREFINDSGIKRTRNEFLTKGNTPYEGWGTGLKPANEPIVLARKPIEEKTITENVLRFGTGGINIDGCRIEASDQNVLNAAVKRMTNNNAVGWKNTSQSIQPNNNEGRFPANFIIDEEASKLLDEQSGNSKFFYVPKVSKKERNLGLDNFEEKITGDGRKVIQANTPQQRNIHNPKKNHHPTVKPINLLTYLVRLITPPNGIVMDCYMGSGSTGIAARLEGFQFIGMEMDEDYYKIAETRINNYELYKDLIKKK
jgi:site-specific DNA-methyltransferase (adenine-specific)